MKQLRIKLFYLIALTMMVVVSCEKEFSELSHFSERDLKEAIEETRGWYEANKPQQVQTKAGSNHEVKIKIAPNWGEVFLRENADYKTVEVGAAMNKKITFFTADTRKEFFNTKKEAYKQDMRRFVFLTDKKTNETSGFIMLIVPELGYLKTSKFHPFRSNTYLERDEKFSGYIVYYELDGSFANGWKYEGGVITHEVSEILGEPLPIETKSGGCTSTSIYQYIEECTDHYQYVEYGDQTTDLEYQYTTCQYYSELVGTWETCTSNVPLPGSSGGGGYIPTGAAGGLMAIYGEGSTLSSSDKARLVEAYTTLASQKPIICDILKDLSYANIKISFHIGQTSANAHYDASNKTLIFPNSSAIIPNNLEEELLHAAQHMLYGNGMLNIYSNFEFEVKCFKDIYNKTIGYLEGEWASIGQSDDFKNDYTQWVLDFDYRTVNYTDLQMITSFAKRWQYQGAQYSNQYNSWALIQKYLINDY